MVDSVHLPLILTPAEEKNIGATISIGVSRMQDYFMYIEFHWRFVFSWEMYVFHYNLKFIAFKLEKFHKK